MNTERAIENLIANLDRFPQLPFITDLELSQLFGQEVIQAIKFLEGINREHLICSACGGKCCQQMGCELFDEAFGECPVYEYRPVLCRLHYCEKFGDDQESLIRGLLDIFVRGVSRLETKHGAIPAIELNMLLYSSCRQPGEPGPPLIEDIGHIVAPLKSGEADREKVLTMLHEKIQAYRRSKTTTWPEPHQQFSPWNMP